MLLVLFVEQLEQSSFSAVCVCVGAPLLVNVFEGQKFFKHTTKKVVTNFAILKPIKLSERGLYIHAHARTHNHTHTHARSLGYNHTISFALFLERMVK